jgi:pyruvate formate lyase activating enzyme
MDLNIKVAHLKTSLNDYPQKISSVIFFPFCNLRCPWCHNGELLNSAEDGKSPADAVSLAEALAVIKKRKRLIDAVVLSGGEPTMYADLAGLIARIKDMGLLVKLDTNGLNPKALRDIFGSAETSPDFIAMDLKLRPSRYINLVKKSVFLTSEERGRQACSIEKKLYESSGVIAASQAASEFRSLVFPKEAAIFGGNGPNGAFFDAEDVAALRPLARGLPWKARPFKSGACLDERWNLLPDCGKEEAAAVNSLITDNRG